MLLEPLVIVKVGEFSRPRLWVSCKMCLPSFHPFSPYSAPLNILRTSSCVPKNVKMQVPAFTVNYKPFIDRSIDRPIDRSNERASERAGRRASERAIDRSIDRLLARSLDRSLARSLARSLLDGLETTIILDTCMNVGLQKYHWPPTTLNYDFANCVL